jgi:hypothetical protein
MGQAKNVGTPLRLYQWRAKTSPSGSSNSLRLDTRLTCRCVGVDSTLCYRRVLPCEIAASIQIAIIDCLIGSSTGPVYHQCSQGSVGTGKDQDWAIRYIGTRRQAGPAENLVYSKVSPVSDDSRRSANSRPFGMKAGTDEGRHR